MDEMRSLRLAKSAIQRGDKASGQELLIQLLRAEPSDQAAETAWLWLSAIVDDPALEEECLEQVLEINPGNETARRHRDRLHPRDSAPEPTEPNQPLWPIVTGMARALLDTGLICLITLGVIGLPAALLGLSLNVAIPAGLATGLAVGIYHFLAAYGEAERSGVLRFPGTMVTLALLKWVRRVAIALFKTAAAVCELLWVRLRLGSARKYGYVSRVTLKQILSNRSQRESSRYGGMDDDFGLQNRDRPGARLLRRVRALWQWLRSPDADGTS
jgi:hypothetical protein